MLALDGGAWGEALAALGAKLPPLRAVLVCSAHWESPGTFRISSAPQPGVMHDFGGFPEALYRLDYPAPGEPGLAREVADLLGSQGLEAALDSSRRLDHGAWAPLRHLLPDARVPVVQLSLPRPRTPELLVSAGRALSTLRDQGVLILGSGGLVHNLGRLDWSDASAPATWAMAFETWVLERLALGDLESLLRWPEGPHAAEAVPTSEHLDPLWFALGAGQGTAPQVLFQGWQLGSLSLTSLVFG